MTRDVAPDTGFSKARLEMLCDGIFTVAMTLLVLELKAPTLPRHSEPAVIWHALREDRLSFLTAAMSIALLNVVARRIDRSRSPRAPEASA